MKGWLSVIFAVLGCTTLASAQNQEVDVQLSIKPSDAEVGEMVTITVKSNVQGSIDIDNMPSSFVYGYDMMNGMEQEVDYNTGQVVTYYYMSQSGAFGKSGTFTVGPAFVKSGGKTYASNKVTVTVGKKAPMSVGSITNQQLSDPAFGGIQTNKETIYEGEPIIVSAKVYSKFNPSHLNGYQSFTMNGAVEAHPLGNSNNIKVTEERFKGIDVYTFEYDRQLVFPTGTGKFRIDPYKMNLYQGYSSFPITSSANEVTIKPLPANPPEDFIGAVGSFSISRELDTLKVKQGDVFKLFLTVEGTGNLQNIVEPELDLPKGFIVYGDPIVTENISFNSQGATGSILYEYNVQVSRYGKLELPESTVSYFDTKREQYGQVSTEPNKLSVE